MRPLTALRSAMARLRGGNASQGLGRVLRPQAAYRWMMPQLAAITPQYIEGVLRGALGGSHVQAWELFDLMLDTWPELNACNQELVTGVVRRELIVEPFCEEDEEPTPSAVEKSKLVSAALRGMRPDAASDENGLEGTITDILAGWLQGQVVLEVNWDSAFGSEEMNRLTVGKLGEFTAPRSTFWVHPVCYGWDPETGRLGLRDLGNESGKVGRGESGRAGLLNATSYLGRTSGISEFPADKFLIGIHKAKAGTALGGAMLRPLAWWWCAANFTSDWLLNLAQLFGIPYRWVTYDPSLPEPMKAELDALLQNMGSSGWARFPLGTKMEFLQAANAGQNSPQGDLLDRADRYARLLILGQTLTGSTGTGKGGGLAFGKTEATVKDDRMEAAGKYACGVLNDQLVPSILRLNYGDEGEKPTVRLLEKEEGGLEDAQRDTTLAAGGLKIGENFLYKKYGIPKPAAGEKTIESEKVGKPESGKVGKGESETGGGTAAGDQGSGDAAAVSARAAGRTSDSPTLPLSHFLTLPTAGRELLIAAAAADFRGLNERLNGIAGIEDGATRVAKLAAVLGELETFRAGLDRDPAIAAAIYKILAAGVGSGIEMAGESRKLKAES